MPIGLFNAAAPIELQLTDYSCSVGATYWCLRSVGVDITQQSLQDLMVPTIVSPDLGLLDSSGVAVARLLRERFGLNAQNVPLISFDDIGARAGRQPLAIGGRRWFTNPSTGSTTGHWVAVRRFEDDQIVLANPGGTGPNFGQQALDRDAFARRGTFSAVWIEVDGAFSPDGGSDAGLRFAIGNTDGQGANVRAEPSSGAALVRALREGAAVTGEAHAWRQVTADSGEQGWLADELLEPTGDRFKVVNTDGQGANLRGEPDVSGTRVKLVRDGTEVAGEQHAWRRITAGDGATGWVANSFLVAQG